MNDWLKQAFKVVWNPQPIPRPVVDPHLAHLNGPQRMVESITFFALACEHWISSDGVLREWLRINSRLGLLILSPMLMFMPTISFGLWQIALWTAFLVLITKNLVLLPLAALATIALLGVLVIVFKASVRALAGS